MKPKQLRLKRVCQAFLVTLGCFLILPTTISAQQKNAGKTTSAPLTKDWLKVLQWRSIGPANMSGRVTAISVYENDPCIYYIATASGGLLKTVNNGVTFQHQFDRQSTVSIGDVAVSQKNPDLVWVGTGESNPRNSVSYGDGVYKSTDGGKTWTNMGLKRTFQIGRILIHPKNNDIVYVGALGRLYGPNTQRGLFKTTDGGKTWKKILYIDEHTGVIDMRMHPTDPDTLLVATYERRREVYDVGDPAKKWGKGSGLYRTTDGGKSFSKVTKGLPGCKLGRIGLDWYRKNPNVVYMVLESEKIGEAPKGANVGRPYMGISATNVAGMGIRLRQITKGSPADKAGLKVDDVLIQLGKYDINEYTDLTKNIPKHKIGDTIDVKVQRDQKVVTLKFTFGTRTKRPLLTRLGGQIANKQRAQGKNGFEYGGIYRSDNAGQSWRRVNSLNPRPMYFSQVRVDPSNDKNVYVLGISLYRSNNGGVTFTGDGGGRGVHVDHHALWIDPKDGRHMILGNDGGFYITHDRMKNWLHINRFAMGQFYHVAVGPKLNYNVYGGLQDNGTWGGPSFLQHPRGPVNADWLRIGGGDGFRCFVDPDDADLVYFESQYGGLRRRNLRTGKITGISAPGKKGVSYKWNWNSPFILSHHNSKIYYCAANYVLRSLNRGDNLEIISPRITRTAKGSATALAESPKDANVVYVGSDDGALWMTRDGGKKWSNITEKVGMPAPRCVSSIECSREKAGRVYVTFDAHRSDDDEPYVFVSENYGQSWKSLRHNLPWGSTRCVREDVINPNLLYLGTEFGAWFSLDRGKTWHSLNTNLPTVAVHEIAIHPIAGEIVAATHGRSLWVLDVSALRQMKPKYLAERPALYKPNTTIRWIPQPSRGGTTQRFVGANPERDVEIYYNLPAKAMKVSLHIVDLEGKRIRSLKTAKTPGLHRATWDMRRLDILGYYIDRKKQKRARTALRTAAAGTYRIMLTVDGEVLSQTCRIVNDPSLPPNFAAADEGFPEPEREDNEEEEIDQ